MQYQVSYFRTCPTSSGNLCLYRETQSDCRGRCSWPSQSARTALSHSFAPVEQPASRDFIRYIRPAADNLFLRSGNTVKNNFTMGIRQQKGIHWHGFAFSNLISSPGHDGSASSRLVKRLDEIRSFYMQMPGTLQSATLSKDACRWLVYISEFINSLYMFGIKSDKHNTSCRREAQLFKECYDIDTLHSGTLFE